jgi:hypothetical protein
VATRLYLAAAIGPDAAITPAFTGWQESGSALRRIMVPSPNGVEYRQYVDALATGSAVATTTPGNTTCHRQYISLPMVAGIVWTNGVSTFTAQAMGLESAVNDNIINRVRRVAVYSRNGTTLQATLIALGNATSVAEWNTSLRNLTFLNATAVGAGYTTVAGDRLVAEFGSDDSGGASISGTMRWGITGQTGDLGINETDTTTTLRPWLESSVNLTFESSMPPDRPPRQNRLRDRDPWGRLDGWLS